MKQGSYVAYVGARTTKARKARGNGLNVYAFDARTVGWRHLQLVELENPSFLTFDRTQQFLYTIHGDLDRVSAFRIAPDGTLAFLGTQCTEGKNPVHLAIDPSNRFMIVANHATSTLALLPRHDDGSLGAVIDLVTIEGQTGPHRVEQPFAKPHQVEFDPSGKWIVVPDKGIDKVLVYRIDEQSGKLVQAFSCDAREGAGPRHVAFSPGGTLAYVINELNSTVTGYRFEPKDGSLTPFQILPVLLDTFTGNSRAAEIAVSNDGRFVYASNRGSDTIAVFEVDAEGKLTPVASTATGGRTPRFFGLFCQGELLLAANEDSDTITTFKIDQNSGRIEQLEPALSVGSPVCILMKQAPVRPAAP
ncbi:lactonase family protein [Phyllobacterium salinisoli]|uniref:Lactonase family protein n=1 Tax=Phyllobacterium salinisoli TaxID=1899321 RepID=A0A368JYR1_9HYPH|nr:lactonase family protein [Phyllobacterium salinisoli]RCS22091.1 lactonase family protein [Phyllobacterium salinisoli]